ncbi:hypothetical protein LZ496_11705 [Sphingomonas sp. NSE70-1]|uniref:Uncharacterized protein n=1 Tax=Sphingomonas caseinilyticus TaxID=2908205 RepID=A0ABT0RWP8_9SPHN|nr:hypothetical protein [Sphingomonas caseinilyticus]MCL6699444.1 hypothetical protein [Sphingomonas caseinilyticus]
MNQSKSRAVTCSVVGAEKLLADAGGPASLCELVKIAAAAAAPGVPFAVEIRSPSAHTLAARISLPDGRVLPDLNITINDRVMDRGSIERFASAIASRVEETSRR